VRDLVTGEISSHAAMRWCWHGGLWELFFLSTNREGLQCHGHVAGHTRKGRSLRTPVTLRIHPTCIPVSGEHQSKLTLMSESLRNDGRVWVPKRKEDSGKRPASIPEQDRDYFLERISELRQSCPRDISSRAAKEVCG